MSICAELGAAIMACKMTPLDKKVCDEYETATAEFDQLVKKGVASKRGYQLMPIENRICSDAEINHSKGV